MRHGLGTKLCDQRRATRGIRLCIVVAMTLVFTAWAARAKVGAAGAWFVSPAGKDANDCLSMSASCLTINAAIAKAANGGTVIIASGVYTEGITLSKDLTLIGFGRDATIIDGGGAANIVVIAVGAAVQIEDVTLMNPYGQGSGGVFISGSLTLNNSRVISMYDGGLLNIGILNVANTIVRDNGCGICSAGALTVSHSIISHNSNSYGGGIGNNGIALITDSLIVSNSGYFYGGGVYNDGQGVVTIVNSTIISNAACGPCTGFSAYLPFMKPPFDRQLPRHALPDSGVSTAGGGIFSYSGAVNVENSAIIANKSNGPGGVYSQYTLTIRNSTFSNNLGPYGVGGIETRGASSIVNSTSLLKKSAWESAERFTGLARRK